MTEDSRLEGQAEAATILKFNISYIAYATLLAEKRIYINF